MMTSLTGRGIGILVISLILLVQIARAGDQDVLCWEFTVHPTEEAVPMTGYARGALWTGGTANGTPYGGCIAGTGLQGDGTAVFADASCESGNSGFVVGGWTGGWTMDVSVKAIEDVTDGSGKSLSFKQYTQQVNPSPTPPGDVGRGVQLNRSDIRVVSNGNVGAAMPVDLTSFQIIRLSVPDDLNVYIYLWDAAQSQWTLLGQRGLGQTGPPAQIPRAGIGIGSLAGSTTQSGKFVIDWVRADPVEARGDTGPPLPEPAVLCGSTVTPTAVQDVSGFAGGMSVPFATVDLGTTDVSSGLTHRIEGDGMTFPEFVGGRSCRTNLNGGFMYFAIDDTLAFEGSKPNVTVYFDYYDEGFGLFGLSYDGPGDAETGGQWHDAPGTVALTNTNLWKRGSIEITDGYFANRLNYLTDFRFSRGGMQFYADNVSVAVTGNHGPVVAYSLYNSGDSDIIWDALESFADGATKYLPDIGGEAVDVDYPWLSLTKNPASGPLASRATASVTATVDTSGLVATPPNQPLKAYVKLTDGCPSPAGYAEPFTYAAGSNLVGQGGWLGLTSGSDTPDYSEFVIDGGTELKLNGSGDSAVMHAASHDVNYSAAGVVSVQFKVKLGGAGNPPASFWDFRVYDTNGKQFGYWRGTQFNVGARNPQAAGDSVLVDLASDYKIMEMRIDANNKMTAYYFDGQYLATYPCEAGAGTAIGRVAFERIEGAASNGADYVLMDDLSVSGLGYRLREIDLTVIGCNFSVSPRTSVTATCGGTSTRTFTVTNDGAYEITGLAATEISGSSPYGPHDYPWLTLPDTSGVTLLPGDSVDVTATIDWSQVGEIITEFGSIKFSATCDSVNWGEDKLVNALTVTKLSTSPEPTVMNYNGNVDPLMVGFSQYDGIETGTVESTAKGTGPSQTEDGRAYHIQDLSGSGLKTKLYTPMPIDSDVGITLLARVRLVSEGGNSPELANNLFILDDVMGWQYHIDVTDRLYHVLRVTAKNEGGTSGLVVRLYVDEGPEPLLTLANQGVNTQFNGNDGLGFGAGGSMWAQDIYFDWVTGTNAGAFAPDDEVACLGRSLWAQPRCHSPFADVDNDGDVDQEDFAVFQLCYTGSGASSVPTSPEYCSCLNQGDDDKDGQPDADGDIDSFDLTAFQRCGSGPAVQADAACENPPPLAVP